jgi:hypothetical protein
VGGIHPEWLLDLGKSDMAEIAEALADQTDYEHRWLIDPSTGQMTSGAADERPSPGGHSQWRSD